MIVLLVACICLLSTPSQFSKSLPVQQQKPFSVNRNFCSIGPGRRLIQNLAEDIKTNATKIYQVEQGEKFVSSEGTERISSFLWKKESSYSAQEFPFQHMSTGCCLSFWTVTLSGRGTTAFQKHPTFLMYPCEHSPSKFNYST